MINIIIFIITMSVIVMMMMIVARARTMRRGGKRGRVRRRDHSTRQHSISITRASSQKCG
jgi:hypothetical protein